MMHLSVFMLLLFVIVKLLVITPHEGMSIILRVWVEAEHLFLLISLYHKHSLLGWALVIVIVHRDKRLKMETETAIKKKQYAVVGQWEAYPRSPQRWLTVVSNSGSLAMWGANSIKPSQTFCCCLISAVMLIACWLHTVSIQDEVIVELAPHR